MNKASARCIWNVRSETSFVCPPKLLNYCFGCHYALQPISGFLLAMKKPGSKRLQLKTRKNERKVN